MKIRNGFVSNSSTSSFIIGFEKKPKSINEIKQILFKDEEEIEHPWFTEQLVSTQKLSEVIFNDIKDKKISLSKKKILNELLSGYFDGEPEYPHLPFKAPDKEKRSAYKIWDDEREKFIQETIYKDKIEPIYNKFKFYLLTYSDGGEPFESILENGEVFRNAPFVIRISHH